MSHALSEKFGTPAFPRACDDTSRCFSHSLSLLSNALDILSQSWPTANGVRMTQQGARHTPHRTAP